MPGRTVPDEYLEPLASAEAETKVRRSLFIARLDPCRSEGEARTALARVQAAHRDATHNCWACLLGPDPVVEFSSDAGEPSGTAGRPILGALKRSGMVNLVVVVTRYFGGVKLGVRGLIEAYGGVADLAVAAACPVRRVLSRPLSVRLPYPAIGPVTRLLEDWGAGEEAQWTYGEEVLVHTRVPRSRAAGLAAALSEMAACGTILAWRDEGALP